MTDDNHLAVEPVREHSVPLRDDADAENVEADTVLDVRFHQSGWNLSDAMIDEWGRQSFPASDPPSNW